MKIVALKHKNNNKETLKIINVENKQKNDFITENIQ